MICHSSQNIVDSCVTVLIYWACGFAFAYGEGNSFIGLSHFFLRGYDDYIFWFFQMVFAGTTATVVSGAVAERIRFRIGKFVKDPETGKIVTMVIPGHSALIAALGTFILW